MTRARVASTRPAEIGPERLRLRAGPIRLEFLPESLLVRDFMLDGVELLRGVYPAVRDERWFTLPPEIRWREKTIGRAAFTLRLTALYGGAQPFFRWELCLRGAADGTIRYEADGVVLKTFRTNRAGFCVLHPAAIAGGRCRIEHADGRTVTGVFPRELSPHQPFREIRALTHWPAPGLAVETRLEGDVFEMEDQRNWTDASYKTYCRPLAWPYPYTLEKGARVIQRIELRLGQSPARALRPRPARTHVCTLSRRAARPLQLGLMRPPGAVLMADNIKHLQAVGIRHLQLTLDASRKSSITLWKHTLRVLRAGTGEGEKIGLEITLLVGAKAPALVELGAAIAAEKIESPIYWTLSFNAAGASSGAIFRRVRALWKRHRVTGEWGGGVAGGFVDLNRRRPSFRGLTFASFGLDAQVHAWDDASIMETPATHALIARQASRLAGGLPLSVTPLGFGAPRDGCERRDGDPRFRTAFGAAWTLASLAALTGTPAARVTLDAGEIFSGTNATETPVARLLRAWHEVKPARVHRLEPSSRAPLAGVMLVRGKFRRVLLANLSAEAQRVRLAGLPFAQGKITALTADANSAGSARPGFFRNECRLPAYGLVQIDAFSDS